MENDKISLLPELNGKRRKKEDSENAQAKPAAETAKVISKSN
jgi:hypothetical protein